MNTFDVFVAHHPKSGKICLQQICVQQNKLTKPAWNMETITKIKFLARLLIITTGI